MFPATDYGARQKEAIKWDFNMSLFSYLKNKSQIVGEKTSLGRYIKNARKYVKCKKAIFLTFISVARQKWLPSLLFTPLHIYHKAQ